MTDPHRILPATIYAQTHDQGDKQCVVSTSSAISTVTLSNGHSYAAIVQNQQGCPMGYITLLDRAEFEAHVALLRNAIEDAERLDAGKHPLHAAPTFTRQ